MTQFIIIDEFTLQNLPFSSSIFSKNCTNRFNWGCKVKTNNVSLQTFFNIFRNSRSKSGCKDRIIHLKQPNNYTPFLWVFFLLSCNRFTLTVFRLPILYNPPTLLFNYLILTPLLPFVFPGLVPLLLSHLPGRIHSPPLPGFGFPGQLYLLNNTAASEKQKQNQTPYEAPGCQSICSSNTFHHPVRPFFSIASKIVKSSVPMVFKYPGF